MAIRSFVFFACSFLLSTSVTDAAAAVVFPDCDVTFLQHQLTLTVEQDSHAKHNATAAMPDVVTVASFSDDFGNNPNPPSKTPPISDDSGNSSNLPNHESPAAAPKNATAPADASNALTNTTMPAKTKNSTSSASAHPERNASEKTAQNTPAENGSSDLSASNASAHPEEKASDKTARSTTADNRSTDLANFSLPVHAQRLFDKMEDEFNASERSIASAEDLLAEFEKQTELEIMYSQRAALAEASKLDALKQMDDSLHASMHLQSIVEGGIPAQAKSLQPKLTALSANALSEAAANAAEAARLADVVRWAEGNYTVAIDAAFDARQKMNELSAKIQNLLDTSVLDQLNLTRLVKAVSNSYFLNPSGENVIKIRIRGNLSEVNLTKIVQADIDRHTTKSTTQAPTSAAHVNDSRPSIQVEIAMEDASDGDGQNHEHHEEESHGPGVLPSTAIIIALVLLLGIVLAGIAILRGR